MKLLRDGVVQLIDSFAAVLSRNCQHLLEAELPKLIDGLGGIFAIDFIDQKQRPISDAAKIVGDLAILRHDARRTVDDEQDEVRIFQSALSLRANFTRVCRHRRVAVFESARVGELELAPIIHRHDLGQTVARHPRQVVDERASFAGKPIE